MSEVFRTVFAAELGDRGRTGRQAGGIDLLTAAPVDVDAPASSPSGEAANTTAVSISEATSSAAEDSVPIAEAEPVDLGEFFLVGGGAIGQAAALALSEVDAVGVTHVVDPETVTLSNLQRYVLTRADDVGAVKVDLMQEAVRNNAFGLGEQPRDSRSSLSEPSGGTPRSTSMPIRSSSPSTLRATGSPWRPRPRATRTTRGPK
jgi:hypothetical protein